MRLVSTMHSIIRLFHLKKKYKTAYMLGKFSNNPQVSVAGSVRKAITDKETFHQEIFLARFFNEIFEKTVT